MFIGVRPADARRARPGVARAGEPEAVRAATTDTRRRGRPRRRRRPRGRDRRRTRCPGCLSVYGAFVVDAGLARLGLLIFTGTSFARAKRRCRRSAQPGRAGEVAKTAKEASRRQGQKAAAREAARRAAASPRSPRSGASSVLEALGLHGRASWSSAGVRRGRRRSTSRPPPRSPAPPVKPAPKPRTVTTAAGPYRTPARSICCAPRRPRRTTACTRRRSWRRSRTRSRRSGWTRRSWPPTADPPSRCTRWRSAAGTKVNKVLNLSERHRLRAGHARRADHRAHPGPVGDRHRGAQQAPRLRDAGRHPAFEGGEGRHPSAVGGPGQGHPRRVAQMVNLATMPHVLIAGATGAGKSSLVNCFITSLLMRTTPDDVRLVLIDPKRVEMSHFAEVPHLLSPVIVHPKRAAEALAWIVPRDGDALRDARHGRRARHRRLRGRARRTAPCGCPVGLEDKYEHLPYIVVVIDELADLMMVAPRDVEDAICRIAQMARAVGIHLVVATQRPSVDVVTGSDQGQHPQPDRADDLVARRTRASCWTRTAPRSSWATATCCSRPRTPRSPSDCRARGSPRPRSTPSRRSSAAQREVVYEQHIEGLGPPADRGRAQRAGSGHPRRQRRRAR